MGKYEYNDVKKRYEYISAQLGDLRASREDLEKILSEIDLNDYTKKYC